MPYIKTRLNIELSKEKKELLKNRLGIAISNLGKSEQWLMVDFDSNCDLYFRGNSDNPIAYVEVKLYGNASADSFDRMTSEISDIFNDILSIDKNNIYVSYFPTDYWGWNGHNF